MAAYKYVSVEDLEMEMDADDMADYFLEDEDDGGDIGNGPRGADSDEEMQDEEDQVVHQSSHFSQSQGDEELDKEEEGEIRERKKLKLSTTTIVENMPISL